jgi:hypothetical protein
MLPDADDFPSLPPELAGDAAVAGHVGLAFAVPEGAVGFRAGVALGAAVPEASVDEDGDFILRESEVGLSGQSKMPSPAGDLVLLPQGQQRVLRLFVALSPDEGHDVGAFLSGPNIHRSGDQHQLPLAACSDKQ